MKTLSIGDMIGAVNAAEFTSREKHLATVTAATDGILAVLPFGELKMEVRKNPQEVSLSCAVRYSVSNRFPCRFSKFSKLQPGAP